MFTIYVKKGIQKSETISQDYVEDNIILNDGGNVLIGGASARENYNNTPDKWERLISENGYIDESFLSMFSE